LISEGKIPLLSSGIVVKSKVGRTQIAWEDIYQIQVKKKGLPTWLVGGLIVGAIMVYLLLSELGRALEGFGI